MLRLDHTDRPPSPFIPNWFSGGLDGYWWETERQVCISWIASENPHAFLRFLREQEAKGKAVVFPTVINARLERLLQHRGYQRALLYVYYMRQDTECLVLRPEILSEVGA